MKKGIATAGLLVAIGLTGFGVGGAQGATLNGCMATAAEPLMALSCTYVADAAGQFVNTSRAHFTITVVRGGAVVETVEGYWGLPAAGALSTITGDSVTVQIDKWGFCKEAAPPPDISPYVDPVAICPLNGAVSAGDL